jgi:hypothetical protein
MATEVRQQPWHGTAQVTREGTDSPAASHTPGLRLLSRKVPTTQMCCSWAQERLSQTLHSPSRREFIPYLRTSDGQRCHIPTITPRVCTDHSPHDTLSLVTLQAVPPRVTLRLRWRAHTPVSTRVQPPHPDHAP